MQMGRWFGFRPGYRDLVRLYIARREPLPGGRWIDLYKAFEDLCRDEEALRQLLHEYEEEGIIPKQVPPLIQQSHPDLLPTARNKMWNAYLRSKNIGGKWQTRTLISLKRDDTDHNLGLMDDLLHGVAHGDFEIGNAPGRDGPRPVRGTYWEVGNEPLLEMLSRYRWASPHGNNLLTTELGFLRGEHGDPELDDWVIIAPKRQHDEHGVQRVGDTNISIVTRGTRADSGRIDALHDPYHRPVCELIAGTRNFVPQPNLPTGLERRRRGVVLLYVVKPMRGEEVLLSSPFPVAFHFLPPPNSQPRRLLWGVHQPGDAIAVPLGG
jgi:hypothetical protein